MPESVNDRCTKSHEYIFLLSKNARYYFDGDAIAEPCLGENLPGNTKHKYTSAYNDGATEHRTKSGLVAYAQKRRDSWKGSQFGKGKTGQHQLNRENGLRNKRSVWTVNTTPCKEAHFAVFPEKLIEPMIKAGCPVGGIVLDPFIGSGTTGRVARRLQRNFIGIDLNEKYCTEIAKKRLSNVQVEMLF